MGSRGRRKRRAAARSGPWLAGAAAFAVIAGAGGYLVLHLDGHSSAAEPRAGASAARSAVASPTPCPTPVVLPADTAFPAGGPKAAPINVRVTVLDGSGQFGEAETVLEWLQNHNPPYLRSSNGGPTGHTTETTLVYAPDHVDQARRLAADLKLPARALHGDGKTSDELGRMVLTLGSDFHGIGKPFAAPVTKTPGCVDR